MMNVKELTEYGFPAYRLENTQTGEYIAIFPRFGANLYQAEVRMREGLIPIIRGYNDIREFRDAPYFRSSLLLPFPNRIMNGVYRFAGREYSLPVNFPMENNACHGFLYNRGFEVSETGADGEQAFITLHHFHDGNYPGYPFIFDATVTYYLDAQWGVVVEVGVENTGDGLMPLGIGWHPYFSLGRPVDGLELEVSAAEVIAVDASMIPTGEKIPFSRFPSLKPIGPRNLDHGFLAAMGDKSELATTVLRDPSTGEEIRVWQETGAGKCNHLQVYIPPERTAIAIEPMTCRANGFNNGEGLITLASGEYAEVRFGFQWSFNP